MIDSSIYKTDYFSKPWTWAKRIFLFLFFIFILIAWEVAENPWNFWWIKYALFTFLSVGLLLSPVDDIMVDDQFFYHIKTSLLKNRTKIYKYELSTIKSIRCLGVHVPGFSVQEMVMSSRQISTDTNSVEIVFKDDSFKSVEVGIYKEELIFFVEKIRQRLT